MRCLACDREGEPRRVAVTLHDGRVYGGYCRSCESAHFGESLERGDRTGDPRCVLCSDRGSTALPLREIEYVETSDGEVRHETYPVTPATPRLCADHVAELFDVGEPPTEQTRLPELATPSDASSD